MVTPIRPASSFFCSSVIVRIRCLLCSV
jgi:hypothetical protein